jgi:hypothetical protein
MHENREISSTPWSDDQGRSAKAKSRTADMHALEKSDCAVVPVNQPNNEGQEPSAEAGEGRAQTAENIVRAAKLVGVLTGERPVRGTCPVAPVVIPGGGKGDQSVESPGVKVPVGWVKTWSAPTGGRANRQVVARANRGQAPKTPPHENRRVGEEGSAETVNDGLRQASSAKELGACSRRTSRGLRGRHVDKEQSTKAWIHSWVA